MHLPLADIQKVATLAKLDLADDDLKAVSAKLQSVLAFIAQLNEVDTSGIEEMAHPGDLHSVLREDCLAPSLPRESALKNAPKSDGEFFLVPPVLG